MKLLLISLVLFSPILFAKEQRIVPIDRFCKIQHHLPSYTIENSGRILETDRFGHKQYQNGAYKIDGNKIKPINRFGHIQPNKPSYSIEKNGRIIETDRFGNKQYQNGGYQIKGDKIQAINRFGNVKTNKSSFIFKQ